MNAQDLERQLLCYAADLHELMDQHSKLQQRYQIALHAQAGTHTGNDLLLSMVLHSSALHLVTTPQGQITRYSEGAEKALCEAGTKLEGLLLTQLTPPDQQTPLIKLLDTLCANAPCAAAELRQLVLCSCETPDHCQAYDALVIPTRNPGHPEIYWLLHPACPAGSSDIDIQKSFLTLGDHSEGLMITDTDGQIIAINATFCQITGYSEAEVVGKNTRFLSSGRHSAAFYQAFWDGLLHNGGWNGEMFNRRKNGQIYPEWKTVKAVKNSDGKIVSYLAAYSDISNRARDQEQLFRLAYHDALTDLPNRRLLEDRMTQAMSAAKRDNTGLCVLFMDLDRFKPINDELGHDVGDLVLQEVSQRLKTSVRQGDTVARVGGDEFVILLRNVLDPQIASHIAATVLHKLTAPLQAGKHSLSISASLGCARYPDDSTDMATLLKQADAAMYTAKQDGTRFRFFETLPAPDTP